MSWLDDSDARRLASAKRRLGILRIAEQKNHALAVLRKHGVDVESPEQIEQFFSNASPADMYDYLKETGVSRDAFIKSYDLAFHDHSPTASAAKVGAAGAVIGAVATPVREALSGMGTSWESFIKAAPKNSAVGAVIGSVLGVAAAKCTRGYLKKRREEGVNTYDEMAAAWQKREAEKNAAARQSPAAK